MTPPPTGLSPRVRGNHLAEQLWAAYRGSIPACAGEPRFGLSPSSPRRVYPRVCGGTRGPWRSLQEGRGLSPRVRGNPHEFLQAKVRLGSIPACAGEPPPSWSRPIGQRVYPRVCGGTMPRTMSPLPEPGLSPRVRGNQTLRCRAWLRGGSIPACAGEPLRVDNKAVSLGVYPRVCGGTGAARWRGCVAWGLSPRVRGNPLAAEPPKHWHGSIPACAGEPTSPKVAMLSVRVYPRVCGGTVEPPHVGRQRPGLSPRVRGNPELSRQLHRQPGSIPACAGEPHGRQSPARR